MNAMGSLDGSKISIFPAGPLGLFEQIITSAAHLVLRRLLAGTVVSTVTTVCLAVSDLREHRIVSYRWHGRQSTRYVRDIMGSMH